MMAYPWGRTHLKRLVVPAVFFLALYLCVVALGTRSKGVLHSTERPPSSEHQELPLPKEVCLASAQLEGLLECASSFFHQVTVLSSS